MVVSRLSDGRIEPPSKGWALYVPVESFRIACKVAVKRAVSKRCPITNNACLFRTFIDSSLLLTFVEGAFGRGCNETLWLTNCT